MTWLYIHITMQRMERLTLFSTLSAPTQTTAALFLVSPVLNLEVILYKRINQIILAIAGQDFCIVATDTRISQGYNILSRVHSKSVKLTDKCILTTAGMVSEVESLHKNLMLKVRLYKMQNKREPSVESLA